MGQIRVLRTDDFTGGLNLRADPFQLAANESPDMLNVDVDPRGGVFQRGGSSRFNASAIGSIANGSFTPKKLFGWQRGTPQLFVAANGTIYYGTSTSFTSTTVAYTATDGPTFATWTGTTPTGTPVSSVYIACGQASANLIKWDGSTATALTPSGAAAWQNALASPSTGHGPRGDFVASHVDRLWVASTYEDGAGYPNRVRFSHPNFPESWREQDYIDIVSGGDGITAMVPFNGALLVFKKTSVHAIYGYDTDSFQVVALTEAIGALNSNCVVATERGLFMFSWPDGLFMYDGNGFVDLFEKLRPLITLGQVNGAALGNVWISHCNNRVWLSLPLGTDTTPSFNFVYDPSIRAWTKYTFGALNRGMACMLDWVASNGTRYHLATHPTNPFVIQVDRFTLFTDDVSGAATNFGSYYVTRWQDAEVVSAKKMWRRPDLIVTQPTVDTTLTVQVYHNWEEALVKRTSLVTISAGAQNALMWREIAVSEPDAYDGWGQAPWGANAEGAQFKKASNLGLARSVQLKIAGEGGKPWGINSISYKYIARKVR